MAKPTQGQPYTTIQGDTVHNISIAAFGVSSNYPKIIKLNQAQTPLTENGAIPTGTVLLIPRDNVFTALRQAQLRKGLNGT